VSVDETTPLTLRDASSPTPVLGFPLRLVVVRGNQVGRRFVVDSSSAIGRASPEAAAGGAIGLVRNGDRIRIDIPNRRIDVLLSDEELAKRRAEQDALGWKPAQPRPRKVSAALKAYARLVMSADKGAVRDLSMLDD